MADVNQSIASRWTPRLVKGGWTPISTYFIDNYHRLDPRFSTLEAMLVIQLIRHKWDEKNPHPTFGVLSQRMGISDTAARGHARSLEKKGYLRRISTRGMANEFDLTPLFKALERLAVSDEMAKSKAPPSKVDPIITAMRGENAEFDDAKKRNT